MTPPADAAAPHTVRRGSWTRAFAAWAVVFILVTLAVGIDQWMSRSPFYGHASATVDKSTVPGLTTATAMGTDGQTTVVADRIGLVLAFPSGDIVLDIRDRVRTVGIEEGLLGVDLADGQMFVHYIRSDQASVVTAFPFDGVSANPERETVLWHLADDTDVHNGGGLVLTPDGLVFGVGSGRRDYDSRGDEQEPPHGSILALPLAGGEPDVLATGFRNPWQVTYDPVTGDYWTPDTGSNSREEVNRIPAGVRGLDFGWSGQEGSRCIVACQGEPPVADYQNQRRVGGPACAVVGGAVYRGSAPELLGRYLFGDWCSGAVWSVAANDPGRIRREVATDWVITAFGTDADGEVYVLDMNGHAGRIAYPGQPEGRSSPGSGLADGTFASLTDVPDPVGLASHEAG